jgi:hypothetical protein
MLQTLAKPLKQENDLQRDVVIQISKQQILKFFQFIVFLSIMTVNIIALSIESSFIKELLVSQTILAFIFLIKNSKSNTIIK